MKDILRGNAVVGQSGGPTAAINATLTGVIKGALENECIETLYGMRNGIEGLMAERFVDLSALFALCFDMTSCVLIYDDRVMLAVRTFDISRFLRRNCLPCPDNFAQHFCGRLCNANIFTHAHTSSGSTNSTYGRSSRYPSCRRRIMAADLDTPSV